MVEVGGRKPEAVPRQNDLHLRRACCFVRRCRVHYHVRVSAIHEPRDALRQHNRAGICNLALNRSRSGADPGDVSEVYLVNAHYLKSVPGRKSDVSDCQWIQYLHSVGLLKASFRPPGDICAVRSLWRHRGSLLQMASEHILHMQKSLSQMNLQIHHVLSDITGSSGQAILDAILAGERDPMQLAQLCNWCKGSEGSRR